jgi:hypothetical protein
MDDPIEPGPSKVTDAALTFFLLLSFVTPFALVVAGIFAALLGFASKPGGLVAACIAGGAVLLLSAAPIYRWVRDKGRSKALRITEAMAFVVLPVWGLFYNHFLAEPTCEVGACSDRIFRPFAEPEVFGLVALHALTVVAYCISRRRPRALRPYSEALVHATLLAGVLVHIVIGVHIAPWTAKAFLVPPLLLPCFAPVTTVILYSAELHGRLRRRGREAAMIPEPNLAPTAYRHAPPEAVLPPLRLHLRGLLRAIGLAPVVLGLHAVLQALWLGRTDAAIRVFTRTCDQVLSLQQVVILPQDCHYLCTVAARGHAWLVRPERLGRRGGIPIVVNRQLAIANAFEDLLRERWPRFGRLARRVYDRVGLPVSRYIRRPWLADLTYLAMKPAEWLFAAALLLLDRGDPEERIDRMYR